MTDRQLRIVVVGDTLLDVDVSGTSERLSPDAPVPVLDVRSEQRRAGGAGLVATMLAKDGHDVRLVTVLGDDAPAERLRSLLPGVTIVEGPSGAPTPVKTRVRVGDHALVRIDEGCDTPPVPAVTAEMRAALEDADAVVVADYGRGLTAAEDMRSALTAVAERTPVVWDPHPKGEAPVVGVTVVTPNASEAQRFTGLGGTGVAFATDAAADLVARWAAHAVAVTMGERGALVGRRTERGLDSRFVPAPSVTAGDPCGAGDRLAAGVAVALASGAEIADAVTAGVADASTYLAAGGVASLVAGAPPAPIAVPGADRDALRVVHDVRAAGGVVVATGGCFDLLHAGHARTLSAARALGDCLVVCLNSDESVRGLKGPDRPIMGQDDRVELLLALDCVDAVVVFDESTPDEALRRFKPDVWAKGGDYTADELPESVTLAEWGGRVVTVPFHPGRSTTRLAAAIERVG
ncbi:D-beta-D-heptose 1-phosphate adenosyltransferase [Curtobacterium sp. MCJR17_055]|uniref:PfkB family carbohydrate kinase n=1 Tax=unclassified Curtobacterium TaxID=257496 RepID=UPI000D9DBC3B|nr:MULTISPECIES: PfkB family carbohydrate kinase [unclassified Curtobacterium]PYY32683.1 D-beta-D-heptose 1-phosphate adenosyltransferase [Curtobacterium sp. MCBD17_029]PYY55707.1 D-beta-D-heptose 1-phosphate adenosyltransferase [Curtobacterium sp. MCJR17_055]PYY60452.1 D-beta-D-heptose 1-phosphate adenosyltransferase [Curtobacterium sp. MCPF17_015]